MTAAQFTHPTIHIIDATRHRVIESYVFAENRWYGDHEVFARGLQRYRIERQQTESAHYYVWVTKVEEFANA